MNSTEKHEQLIDAGWRTRADGLMWPPTDWSDQRARTPAAAWAEHVEQHDPSGGGGDTLP